MSKHYFKPLLIACLLVISATVVLANPGGGKRHQGKSKLNFLARLDLNEKQTEKIRDLRLSYEKSIMPLKLEEHQAKAELEILWLQIKPDSEKIKSAQRKMNDIRLQLLEKETDFRIAVRSVLTDAQISRLLALGEDRCNGPGGPDSFGLRPPPRRHQSGIFSPGALR